MAVTLAPASRPRLSSTAPQEEKNEEQSSSGERYEGILKFLSDSLTVQATVDRSQPSSPKDRNRIEEYAKETREEAGDT